MLAVSPLRNTKDENQEEMESFSMGTSIATGEFCDLSDGNLLESINFDDFFVGINVDGDVLPDLEMDSEIFAEFSAKYGEESEINSFETSLDNNKKADRNYLEKEEEEKAASSTGEESVVVNPLVKDGGKGRKSSKNNSTQGKRKVKVDWTPELHRRFVQAVEQLGVDKAVPSRILEIMGIDCLTRHNIASHLQKYRSHRKHLLAREAEAGSWNQRRQVYGVGGKRDVISPWPAAAVAPTMGFIPAPLPPMTPLHHFRPLHVWGHPSMDQSFMHMWPKHLPHSPPPPPPISWSPAAAPPPPQDPSFWHHQQRTPTPSAIIPGTHFFPPQPLTTVRSFGCPLPGMMSTPPHGMYKADHGIGGPGPGPFFDFHPSKESVDAAIGDVLSKPWLPLPLGLKAPALDSVMGELQRQGISNIPPSCA